MYKIGDVAELGDVQNAEKTFYSIGCKQVTMLDKGKKVYLFPSCNVRKKHLGDLDLVGDPDEAEICIVPSMFPYLRNRSWSLFRDPSNRHNMLTSIVVTRSNIESLNKIVTVADILRKGTSCIKEDLIDTRHGIGNVMSDEEYEKLSGYMKSKDSEMLNLGLKLIFGFDMTINEHKVVLLFAQIQHLYLVKRIKPYILIKQFLRKKYPGLK